MPLGFKLETEENILKSFEIPKNQGKKYKQSRNKDNSGKTNNRNAVAQKKRNQGINNLDNIPPNISQETFKIFKKYKSGLDKIKQSKYALNYYQPQDPDVPCLSNLEKKVNKKTKNFEEKKESKINKKKKVKYISPFPVPGYTLDENLWDFVCDLNDKEETETIKEKDNKDNTDKNSFTGIRHLLKKRKNKSKTKILKK